MKSGCKKTFYFIVFFFLLFASVSSQPKCKIEYYSTEQGLSHQRVTTIIKDREGFLWFGSWDGINRFDGHSFVSYKSSPGDLSQLSNDRIDQIVEDQTGHLWIQAYDRQVYRFDKKTGQFLALSDILSAGVKKKVAINRILAAANGCVWLESVYDGLFCVPQTNLSRGRFTRYKQGLPADFRLPSNTLTFFHEDAGNRIWIGTPDGLCCLKKSGSGNYTVSQMVPAGINKGISLTGFDEDAKHVYFGTADGRLIIFNKRSNNFTLHKIANGPLNDLFRSRKREVVYATTSSAELVVFQLKEQQAVTVRYPTNEPLHSLYEDRQGCLWIEPDKLGAIRFEPLSRSFTYFSQQNEEGQNFTGNRFRILEDNNGRVWVNMKNGGFGYFNEASQAVEYFLHTPDGKKFRLPKLIITIYYDKAGILWLTTYEKQLIKIIVQSDDFKQQLLSEKLSSSSDNEVRGILYDKQNRLWIGAKSGRFYVYQNGKRLTSLFENEPKESLGPVYSILQDSRGVIWLGTKGNGLYKASPVNQEETTYRLTHFAHNKIDSNGLPGNEIYALLEDIKGRIWIGSFDNGLALVDDGDSSTKFIRTGDAFKKFPKEGYRKIRTMEVDGKGNIWIGTTDGLLVLNADDRYSPVYSYAAYSKIPGDKESLGNNDIQFIHRDAKNRMWLATSGGGFCQANGDNPFETLRFRNYTTRDGMPNDYVLSLAADKAGNLWLATENGLSKFNPETKVFRNYDSYDGLPEVSFSEASVSQQPADGQLVFGTTEGFLAFDPQRTNTHPIPATIAFTNLQINNENAGPGTADSVLKTDINYVAQLELKYNQNIISIDYAMLDYRAGSRQEFAYRLIGFDSTWYDDRQFRRATYTNLPPGRYVFEVKSQSAELYSNQPYRRLAIHILPPPWKTWWAYTLYVLFTGTLLFFIRRYALAMIRLRNKIAVEQKLAALKLNFFTNVSHELRTPLTLIVNPLEQVAIKGNLSPEMAGYIDVARKNAARLVRFINQLLDLRKVQSEKDTLRISRVEIVSFVRKLSDHFTEAARSKRIKMETVSEEKELVAWVDAEKLDVVIYNLLGNAIKFSPEGKTIKLLIEALPREHSFCISVADEGPGVKKEKLEKIFEFFQQDENTNNSGLKGTGIGLALTKEFVNLHGGRVWADNNVDGGLTVTVKLKSGTGHYTREEVSFVDLPKTASVYETTIEKQLLTQFANKPTEKNMQAPLVLLVEDNDELRLFIKGQLSEFYRVETARDGQEGLQKAVSLIPDLIVSDIMMPKIDGIQLLDKVKNDVNTSHIPVVLLSARYSIESQMEGLRYGADYYITKPFNNEYLIASIDNLLRQRQKLFELMVEKKTSPELSPSPIVITSKDETFLKEVIQTVNRDMGNPDFTVESLAVTMFMSQNTFYKKFKSLTGLTLVEFVRDMRLQRAKQLLDARESNISEVAYEVGFNNPRYFSTCFKEKYHLSPSDYLKSMEL